MTDRRLPGLVLLLLAGGLYLGAIPMRRAAAEGEAEYHRLRAEGEPLRRRLVAGEAERTTEEAWRQASARSDRSVTGVRRALLESMAGAPVTGVRLSVAASSPPLVARAQVAARGSFTGLLDLAERLVGPGTGIVPERLRFTLAGSDLGIEVEGAVLGPAQ